MKENQSVVDYMVDGHPELRLLVLKYYIEKNLKTHLRVPAQAKDVDALTALVAQTSEFRFRDNNC